MAFTEFKLTSGEFNPFNAIGNDWYLLTSGSAGNYNTMTASWGCMGVAWGKNTFTALVRPSRHTFKYMEENDTFTVSFFDEKYRDALKFCGANSGRDVDKAKETGLTPYEIDGTMSFSEADMILVCKKIYRSTINEDNFIDNKLWDFYKTDPFHVYFVGEILKAYKKIV